MLSKNRSVVIVGLIFTIIGILLLFSSCKNKEYNTINKKIENRLSKKEYEEALSLIEMLKKDNPSKKEVLRLEGIARMGKGEYEAAIECFDTVLNQNKKKKLGIMEQDIVYYKSVAQSRLGNYEAAYRTLETMPTGKEQRDVFLLKGMLALKMGRKQDAILAFDKAIETDKNNILIYIDIFRTFSVNNYTQSGKDYLSSGIKVAQKSGDNLNLGKLYYFNEEYEMAIKSLENELKNPLARVYMAKAMYKRGDVKGAYGIAENAIRNNEQNSEYYNIMGLYYIAEKDYKKAMTYFVNGLNLPELQNDCELRYNEAVVYEFMGDFSTAKKKMEALLRDYPDLESAKREFLFLKTR